jgi:hypothetical protein
MKKPIGITPKVIPPLDLGEELRAELEAVERNASATAAKTPGLGFNRSLLLRDLVRDGIRAYWRRVGRKPSQR